MNFKKCCDLYLKSKIFDWKNSTYEKNLSIINNRLNYFFDRDIKDIKVSDIKLFFNSIDDVCNKSKQHYLTVLRGIFQSAIYDEIINKNPLNHIKNFSYKSSQIEPFNSDEVLQILSLSDNYNLNFKIFVFIGFFTGMRTGEILALKVKDIDLYNKIIHINSTRSRFGEGFPKTNKSKRVVPIIDILFDLLYDIDLNNKVYLLETQYHLPYRDCYIFLGFWKKILNQLNLKYRRPYTMRHTYATTMLLNNYVTPLELSQLLGHCSPKMIYDVYVNYINNNFKDFKRDIKIY